ncbi:MAG: hypothetical protein ACKO96_26560, partial [Flammeovirgaceae bacterium]
PKTPKPLIFKWLILSIKMKALKKIQGQLIGAKQSVYVNQKLRMLDERKVRLTFTDIFDDYTHYRKAYFFHQVLPTPKELT